MERSVRNGARRGKQVKPEKAIRSRQTRHFAIAQYQERSGSTNWPCSVLRISKSWKTWPAHHPLTIRRAGTILRISRRAWSIKGFSISVDALRGEMTIE